MDLINTPTAVAVAVAVLAVIAAAFLWHRRSRGPSTAEDFARWRKRGRNREKYVTLKVSKLRVLVGELHPAVFLKLNTLPGIAQAEDRKKATKEALEKDDRARLDISIDLICNGVKSPQFVRTDWNEEEQDFDPPPPSMASVWDLCSIEVLQLTDAIWEISGVHEVTPVIPFRAIRRWVLSRVPSSKVPLSAVELLRGPRDDRVRSLSD